ncbi:hypothetical protein [Emticicia sp. SJ17W-69]|uniref:hypothetical protein n=1 Tax=Emticicia sp. SJ17W-69 TaxID=3421657 RepID=UPI003EB9D76B
MIKKGSNTVSLSYLQGIKTIAKGYTDKVLSYADAVRNKIDDLCGNAKDKIKVTATSLKLFRSLRVSRRHVGDSKGEGRGKPKK